MQYLSCCTPKQLPLPLQVKKRAPKQYAGSGGLWGDADGAVPGEKWLQVLGMVVFTGEHGCNVAEAAAR